MTRNFIEIPSLNEKLLAGLHVLESGMNGNRNSVVNRLRKPAMEKFLRTGFPSVKSEEWRFTPVESSLKKVSRISFDASALPAEILKFISLLEPKDAYKVLLMNSKLISISQESMEGMELMSLSEAQKKIPEVLEQHYGKYLSSEHESFSAINTALSKDGVVLHVKKNVAIDKPIHIIHIHDNREDGNFYCTRVLVVLEENAQATITETHFSLASHFSFANIGAEIKVGENARLEYQLIQHLSVLNQGDASIIDSRQISLQKNSFCNFTTVTLSGQLIRNNLNVRFDDQHGESHFFGLYLPSGNQLIDNHTVVDHALPHCFSNEFYKGIITGTGRGVFNGKIFVRKDAQKTNAYQNNRNLLLSEEGQINAKPQLEIFADDVKCTHGATTGQLDEEALFYLRARGIGENEAKKMLTLAFAEDMLSHIRNKSLYKQLEKWIKQKLAEVL